MTVPFPKEKDSKSNFSLENKILKMKTFTISKDNQIVAMTISKLISILWQFLVSYLNFFRTRNWRVVARTWFKRRHFAINSWSEIWWGGGSPRWCFTVNSTTPRNRWTNRFTTTSGNRRTSGFTTKDAKSKNSAIATTNEVKNYLMMFLDFFLDKFFILISRVCREFFLVFF